MRYAFLIFLFAGVVVGQQPDSEETPGYKPNRYVCTQDEPSDEVENLKISYILSGQRGAPVVSVNLNDKETTYRGGEIHRHNTAFGWMVSVVLSEIPDHSLTWGGILLPNIVLKQKGARQEFTSVALTNKERTSILGPTGLFGLLDELKFIKVKCIASVQLPRPNERSNERPREER